MSAMVGALFFVRQGWEADFTTLPPLFVRHPPLHREGYNKVTPSAPTGHLPLPGLPQRFCEAKDLWEEGEKALSWQSHSVALTAFELGNGALYAPFPDRARALPREKSGRKKRSGCCKAIARICALRRRGRKGDIDCFAATRRQGRAGSLAIYSLRHGVGLTTPPSCLWQATVSRGGENRLYRISRFL